MSVERAVAEADPAERFVLLAVAAAERRGETPVRSYEALDWCRRRSDELAGTVVGEVTRTSVIRALESLGNAGLVAVEEETSPVGKGRPAHALDAPVDGVLDALEDDEHVGGVASSVTPE
jgi:predicted ArsR family transcriptional regulator